jgi:hypothetical protein
VKEVFSVKPTKEEIKKGGKTSVVAESDDEVEDSEGDSSEEEKHYKGGE